MPCLDPRISLIKKLLSYNEPDEDANPALLKAYAAQNNQEALTDHYRRSRELYRKELGKKPFAGLEAVCRMVCRDRRPARIIR